jgi:outer membrane protein
MKDPRIMETLRAVVIVMVMLSWITPPADAAERVFTLDDAFQAALGSNEIVKIAEEDVSQSNYHVDQAWSFLYPRLNARASYTRFNETLPPEGGPFLFQPLDQYQAALVLTQPLYTGGRTLAAFRTAKKLHETSSNSLGLARQDIMLRVAEAYYGVLRAQKAVEISKRSLERIEHHKKVTEREASTRKNKANQSALLRANSLVAQARITLVRAQDGFKIAREKLSLLTRLPLDIQPAEPSQLEMPTESLEGLRKTALMNRDDYANSRLNRNIAEESVTIVQGGHYPQLSAEAGATYQDSRPATALDSTAYYAGLRLQVPIFEGGLMKAEVSEARSKVRQAELASDLLRQSIESDVHEAYVNVKTAASVLETARLQMDYAKESFDAVQGMFTEGLLASLSLIDAEQALTFAEREVVNAGYERELAILRLKRSMGTLGKNI